MLVVDGPIVVGVDEEEEPLEPPGLEERWARALCASSVTAMKAKILNKFER